VLRGGEGDECSRPIVLVDRELGKHTRSTYLSVGLRSCEPFILIHSDVWVLVQSLL
jgi:hypothetical protein